MIATMSSDTFQLTKTQGRKHLVLPLLVVTALHGTLLLIPSKRQVTPAQSNITELTVRLVSQAGDETPIPADIAPPATASLEVVPTETPITDLPRQTILRAPTQPEPKPPQTRKIQLEPESNAQSGLAARILSSPFLEESPPDSDPFAVSSEAESKTTGFRFADRSTPDSVLYPPEMDLPFADSPRLALEFYDNGLMGDFQRFRDSVTWSKTWTSKNGTKFGCALVLIIPACAWD